MITLAKQHPILLPDEVKERATRLVADFPSLTDRPGFQLRLNRAIALATRASSAGTIIEVYPGTFQMQSDSNPNGRYLVDTVNKTCTCPDAGKGHICKHRLAVALYAGWFEQEKPAPAEELHSGYYGFVTDPQHTRIRVRVRIAAVDGMNNLVTMQTEPINGSRPAIFRANGTSSSVGCYTPDEWKTRFNFAPDREANEIEAAG